MKCHYGGPITGGIASAATTTDCYGVGIMCLTSKGPVTILGAQCVEKSYPAYFDDLKKLGVKME
jgi:3-phosphoshikimate 1-carboxyvinyltransferase